MQYTLRNVPPHVDRALRAKARRDGKSLNEAAVEALAQGVGVGSVAVKRRDLSDLAGTWREDAEFDAALPDQRRIDMEAW